MEWFRVWNEMPNDPKWRTIARKAQQPIALAIAVYVHMLAQASIAQDRGHITGWKDDDIASALDVETEQVAAIRQAMQGKVLDGDLVTGWRKRQPQREDASSTARVKTFRERKKRGETPCNAVKRSETHGNAPDADADADADAESSVFKQGGMGVERGVGARKRAHATAPAASSPSPVKAWPECPDWLPVETWNGFIAHRKAKRKPLTPHAAELVIRDLDKARGFGHDPVALIETAIASGWTGCVFEDKHFHSPPAAPVSHSPASALGREFDEILRGLNRPAIEGEVIREIH